MQSNTDVTDAMIEAGRSAIEPGMNETEKLRASYRAMEASRPTTDVSTDGLVALDDLLVNFVQRPEWREDAVEPENSPEWRAGYEAAQSNLREELKLWWPRGGLLKFPAIKALQRSNAEKDEFAEAWIAGAYKAGYDDGAEDALDAQAIPHNDVRNEGCGDFMAEYYKALSHSGETKDD